MRLLVVGLVAALLVACATVAKSKRCTKDTPLWAMWFCHVDADVQR